MYIFKYINNKTNEVLGYHTCTFNSHGPKEQAKRYTCTDGYEEQLEVISDNLKFILSKDNPFKRKYYGDLTFEDITIEPEYLTDGITADDIQHKIVGIIENGELREVNLPAEQLPELLRELSLKKLN